VDFEPIISFEIHAELSTKTKLFCRCPIVYGGPPNRSICPVCSGQPGALPVLNKKAVEHCVRAGLALDCAIRPNARFARKNYFYPDLPKGYQISQYELPLCEEGTIEIPGDDGNPYPVGIKRIHLEEDAGKLVHSSKDSEAWDFSLVDYNRSGVPLIEIVADHTRNPVRSVREARAYLGSIKQILEYIGISDCIIEQGQFRCDVNVSLRPRGEKDFGDRVEIKNMASFKFIMDAIEYEIGRQGEILQSGGRITQETRLFDESRRVTAPMRSKEDAPDYRYFPDPDLVPLELDRGFIGAIERSMPELPRKKVNRFTAEYGIPKNEALLLTRDRKVSDYFEQAARSISNRKRLTDWLLKDLFSLLNEVSLPIERCPIVPKDFARVVDLVDAGEVTDRIARTVLKEMFATGRSPEQIIEEKNLKPISDPQVLSRYLDEVVAEHPEAVAKVKEGKKEAVHFLIGQVMRKTGGKAHAGALNRIIGERFP
jgi:aspartyl-tRNA(Asn)/glutamyl-tRNA(Gln) amidotransferase subunit B